MSDTSPLTSPSPSNSSFSTACTTLPPPEIAEEQHGETEKRTHHQQKKLIRHHSHQPQQRREITNQTLLLSSPLATLIYTASSTAAALPLSSATSHQIPPRYMPITREKGNVLRKKRARGGRPERLVRITGPEVKVAIKSARGYLDE
jgi:hypothetical protein